MTARCGEMLCGESRLRPKDDDDDDDDDVTHLNLERLLVVITLP